MAAFRAGGPEAGFLKGQTKLEWHFGQVGPKKFESLEIKEFFFFFLTFKLFGSYLAQVPLKLSLSF